MEQVLFGLIVIGLAYILFRYGPSGILIAFILAGGIGGYFYQGLLGILLGSLLGLGFGLALLGKIK